MARSEQQKASTDRSRKENRMDDILTLIGIVVLIVAAWKYGPGIVSWTIWLFTVPPLILLLVSKVLFRMVFGSQKRGVHK